MFTIIDQLHHRTNIEAHYNDDNDGSITAAETPRDRCHEYIGIRQGSSVVSVLFCSMPLHPITMTITLTMAPLDHRS